MPRNLPSSEPTPPSVLVVLLNWNSWQETVAAVDCVLATVYPNFSVVVIDNGSTDGSAAHLRPLASDRVRLLFNDQNLGYTGGCNQGIALALAGDYDFVWLLNNDALTSPDTLASLVRLAESDPRLGLVSPRIASLQEPGTYLNVGGVFLPEIPLFEGTRSLEQAREQARTRPQSIIILGTAMLARTSLLRAIGPLDDRFFAYWEDSDIAVRSIQAGFRNAVDFHSSVRHSNRNYLADPNAIRPHYWYYMSRNETLFWRKHLGLGPRLLKALLWALKLNRSFLARFAENPPNHHALASGIWDGWLGRTGPWRPERRAPAMIERLLSPRPARPQIASTNAPSHP